MMLKKNKYWRAMSGDKQHKSREPEQFYQVLFLKKSMCVSMLKISVLGRIKKPPNMTLTLFIFP